MASGLRSEQVAPGDISDEAVDSEAETLQSQGVCRSDDEHVLALASVSGARLLFTNDNALQDDFRDQTDHRWYTGTNLHDTAQWPRQQNAQRSTTAARPLRWLSRLVSLRARPQCASTVLSSDGDQVPRFYQVDSLLVGLIFEHVHDVHVVESH